MKDKFIDKWKKEQREHTIKMNCLLKNIKKNMVELEKMFEKVNSHWDYEDSIYRYYHHSFKVYRIQNTTKEIVQLLSKISPHKNKNQFCRFFQVILDNGCADVEFQLDHNKVWPETTRPFLEAFFHAKYFLEMAIKYGKELNEAPQLLPSGWASLLCLYNLR